ncbi:SLBB domain-containing protein [Gammaproteobacteria bacterium]|nr:SLBB domain-containing protein [Gammaproteobacteria bacterium]
MNNTTTKSMVNLSTSKISLLILSLLLFNPSLLTAQDSPDELLEFMERLEGADMDGGMGTLNTEDGYKSFVQNELQSIYANMSKLEEQEIEDITFAEINKQRIKHALELCKRDQRACFLIDEYESYKSKEDFPREFETIKLFGQDIFSGYSNEFNFYDSLPIDNDYIIKIGDELKISLFGGFTLDALIMVDMNGSIIIPDIGEYKVAGLPYSEASSKIKADIANKYAGTEAFLSLERIRSKQVFALGNVRSPGTYVLNAFGTALNALISSGGVRDNSSLRNIQIIRKNEIVKNIDLYDLLIKGDVSSADYTLDDGDSILVGGLQSSVSIIGEIIRPAIYEINENQSLSDVISFALGTTPFADKANISVERLLPSGEKTIINPREMSFILVNGDKITVNSSEGQTLKAIELNGAIRNAGEYALDENLTLGSIINIQRDLLENTYTGFAVIKRLNFSSKSYRLVMFNLANQEDLNKLNLYSGDQVFVFSKDDVNYTQSEEIHSFLKNKLYPSKRSSQSMNLANLRAENNSENSNYSDLTNTNVCLRSLDGLLVNPISNFVKAKLDLFQSSINLTCPELLSKNPELIPILIINSIPVVGNVRFPGLYPTTRDLNALEIFNLSGGVLVSKLNSIPSFDVGVRARGFGMYPYEELVNLKNITMLNLQINEQSMPLGYITLKGEFNNPGTYQISKGVTLSEMYERVGGLTPEAYPLAGILTRKSVKEIEQEAISRSKAELSEILSSAVASGYLEQNSTDLVGLISLMTSMDSTQAIGRLVTELNPSLIASNPAQNITLHDGDVIYMPKLLNTVTIVGQVLNPVTVPHKVGASFDYYLKLAGGVKKEADKSKIYVVQPNGVSLRRKNGFQFPVLPFMPFERDDILPGGTLVVPRQARPLDSIALVETITPVLANLSVTAASIAAISDN